MLYKVCRSVFTSFCSKFMVPMTNIVHTYNSAVVFGNYVNTRIVRVFF